MGSQIDYGAWFRSVFTEGWDVATKVVLFKKNRRGLQHHTTVRCQSEGLQQHNAEML
jgi:hypothetical protein